MPVSDTDIAALRERCKAAIDEGRDPLAILDASEHAMLLRLHIDNPLGAGVLLRHLRDYALTGTAEENRWTPRRVDRDLNFRIYADGARMHNEELAQARRDANVISLAEARGARNRPNGPLATLNPAEMVLMNSLRLRGIGLLRQRRDGRVWYDDFYRRIMTDWNGTSDGATISARNVDDEFYGNVAVWFAQEDTKIGNATDRQVISWTSAMARLDKRNAPRDWLNGLTWDGTERLTTAMVAGFGADNSEFNQAVGRCWFVGMVARIMRPGCQLDTMPVLIGPQGIGKSQALRIIGGDWYRSAVSDIHSKDFKQELFGAVVFEIPELHSLVTSNAAAAKVKAVISNQVDHFRLPYGYTVEEYRRTALMVGTTNSRDWHHDESGARRFWPVHCREVDLAWLRDNRDQLFAEARVCFDLPIMRIPLEGDDFVERPDPRSLWWNVPEAEQRVAMEAETAENVWERIIAAKLRGTESIWRNGPLADIVQHDGSLSDSADWGNLLTTQRIAYSWLRLNGEQAAKRATANNIGIIMRRLGWHRVLQRLPNSEDRERVWLPTDAALPPVAPSPPSIFTNPSDPDDIPF